MNRTDKTLRQFDNPLYCQGGPDELPQPPTTAEVDSPSLIQPEDWETAYEAIPLHSIKNRRSFEMSGHVFPHHEANSDKQMQG